MSNYSIAAQIRSDIDGSVVWEGSVEVEGRGKAEAVANATRQIEQTVPEHDPRIQPVIQILRMHRHSQAYLKGEVSELQEYGANFSPDRRYRYGLYRVWDKTKPQAMFIGLNPSTAEEEVNDPTVRRCIRFAMDLGYGGLIMSNAFAFRATSPEILKSVPDPVGQENDAWLQRLSQQATIVIAAWGNHGAYRQRGQQIRKLLPKLYCFGKTGAGEPKHALYLPASLRPQTL